MVCVILCVNAFKCNTPQHGYKYMFMDWWTFAFFGYMLCDLKGFQ